MKFEVGEVAIVNYPSHWRAAVNNGREVVVASELQAVTARDINSGEKFVIVAHLVEGDIPQGPYYGSVPNRRFFIKPEHLRKKPPSPEFEVGDWSQCVWRPNVLTQESRQ